MVGYRIIPSELKHHGIKGQKWGVRRYQNLDGSLTTEGKKRYNVDVEGAKQRLDIAKDEYYKNLKKYNSNPNSENTSKYNKSLQLYNIAEKELKSEHIKEKLNSENNKSKHRLKLEEYYKSKGMNDEEAAVAAYKRDKTEKIIIAAAAVTLTAATIYGVKYLHDKNVDKILKTDTILKRISTSNTKDLQDAFYASFKKGDNEKYIGMYGNTLKNRGSDVFQKSIKLNTEIKVASEKNATKVLSELVKNDATYKQQLNNILNYYSSNSYRLTPRQNKAVNDALKNLKKGKINSKVYDALNLTLVNHNNYSTRQFYDSLKNKGYDAIIDSNDKKLSGYLSKTPLIVFNSNKAEVESVRKLGNAEIEKLYNKSVAITNAKTIAKSIAQISAIAGGINAGKKILETKNNDAIVSDYKKKHPNTELSYNEILKNYYK